MKQLFSLMCSALLIAGCHATDQAPRQSERGALSERAGDTQLREVGAGVWVHTSHYTYPNGTRFPGNGLIVRDGNELLLIDTAWGELLTIALIELIEEQIGLSIRRAVITHSHYDRVAGVDVLEGHGVDVLALPETRARTIAQGTPVPDGTLAGLDAPGASIQIGPVEVFYPGPAHAPDNLMVWVPAARVLFGGCAVRAASSESLGAVADADIAAWLVAVTRTQERYHDVVVVVPGHGESGGSELLDHTLELLARRDGGA